MLSRKVIDEYVKGLVDRFHPKSVILFGSQAAGTANEDSDVDLLVVMDHNCARDVEQEIAIDCALPRTFPLDILVRRPKDLQRRLKANDMALITILNSGRILYERP